MLHVLQNISCRDEDITSDMLGIVIFLNFRVYATLIRNIVLYSTYERYYIFYICANLKE